MSSSPYPQTRRKYQSLVSTRRTRDTGTPGCCADLDFEVVNSTRGVSLVLCYVRQLLPCPDCLLCYVRQLLPCPDCLLCYVRQLLPCPARVCPLPISDCLPGVYFPSYVEARAVDAERRVATLEQEEAAASEGRSGASARASEAEGRLAAAVAALGKARAAAADEAAGREQAETAVGRRILNLLNLRTLKAMLHCLSLIP